MRAELSRVQKGEVAQASGEQLLGNSGRTILVAYARGIVPLRAAGVERKCRLLFGDFDPDFGAVSANLGHVHRLANHGQCMELPRHLRP